MNYLELQENEMCRIKMICYLKRLSMIVTEIRTKLKTGEITLEREKKGKWKTQRGQAPPRSESITSSLVQDNFTKRRLVETGRDISKGGRSPKSPPELEIVDIENLKIRLFGEEFPGDEYLKAYVKDPAIDNRISLLVHISQLESFLRPSEYFDLHGLTTDYLVGKLKEMLDTTKDKQIGARYLSLAFSLKHPAPKMVSVSKPTQNNTFYNFESKQEAEQAVRKQISGMADAVGS